MFSHGLSFPPTIEFAPDSPLEGEGSELLVPLDLHSADRRSSGEASRDWDPRVPEKKESIGRKRAW